MSDVSKILTDIQPLTSDILEERFYFNLTGLKNKKSPMLQNIGQIGGANEQLLIPNRIIFRVTISAPRGDYMNNPAERACRANP